MSSDQPRPSRDIAALLDVMRRLRDPDSGCPWDVEQDFASIAPYTIEEAYEVAEAIERGDFDDLKDELGDLLLQVVFHARMAEEAGRFDFGDVVEAITTKMIRRHPHVFGDATVRSAGAVKGMWEEIKAGERRQKNGGSDPSDTPESLLDGVATALPGLTRAVKLQRRAARAGFDWAETEPVLAKIREELGEVEAEIVAVQDLAEVSSADQDKVAAEIGDLLFAVANLARHVGVDPEAAIRSANAKFVRRFRHIEGALHAAGGSPHEATLDEMEALWRKAKQSE